MPWTKALEGRSTLATASAARMVNGRTPLGAGPSRLRVRASVSSNFCDCASVQCCAPSISDHSSPAASASCGLIPSSRLPMPKRIRPRSRSPSTCTLFQGKGSRSESQAPSSSESSIPDTPCGRSSLATEPSLGSAGAKLPVSNRSSCSRHHARRIAPRRGSVLVATTSANARSRFQSAENAGFCGLGSCSSATLRSWSSLRSAIADGLGRLDDVR